MKISGKKAFKKSNKSWLKRADKAKEHEVAVIRQKSKTDSKGKKHKHARKGKIATVKGELKIKSKKNPVKISVEDNGISKGLIVNDNGKKLFKTPKHNYAIVNKGEHAFTIAANKKGKEGSASVKVEEVKLSKKIAKKYKFVSAAVKHSDAQSLCESFDGVLAEVKEKDIAKILKAAKKFTKVADTEVWIDRVISDESYSHFPTALNLTTGKAVVDPEALYTECEEYAQKQITAITADKKSKKYKKALTKAQAKIRKHMDKALDGKDKTVARAVLCRFD
jgi:hypothetical protein